MRLQIQFNVAVACIVVLTSSVVAQPLPVPEVLLESEVYTLAPPDNGSGPLWSSGCTQVARLGDDVYISEMETGVDVPKLCNTRWRLLRLEDRAWSTVAVEDNYRQREPCPLAVLPPSQLVLNVNDSIELPGTRYGLCKPLLRVFNFKTDDTEMRLIEPQWQGVPYYTDHSYRGFAADATHGHLVMLNIDAKTSVQNACLLSASGETLATGQIELSIRSCYPQVALNDFAVYVLAVGDIVEPVEEWRQYKFEQTQQKWDYVFRRLYFTETQDLREAGFSAPIEIDNVDATCGHIMNQDLWVSPQGEAWILYARREVQHALMRDKFFPGKSIQNDLCLARVKDNTIIEKRVLFPATPAGESPQAKFHVSANGSLYAVLYVTGAEGGNRLMRLLPEDKNNTRIPITLNRPFSAFCLATTRAGNALSDTIDIFGWGGNGNIYQYAAVALMP